MKKILWIGDAGCPSGFAKATHHIVDKLDYRANPGGQFDVTVLGMNYNGDPEVHQRYPYPVYAAFAGGDTFGVGRMIWMCDKFQPDVIVLQQDGWNIPAYVQELAKFKTHSDIPVVAIVAVDGKNFCGAWLKNISLAIFWTQFALTEARAGGYAGPAEVIPLGVDLSVYQAVDKREAREALKIGVIADKFIVGNVNRNQPRKRWDLTLKYFSEWLYNGIPVGKFRRGETRVVNDTWLFLHAAPTGDEGIRIQQLAQYYGILDRLVTIEPPIFYGISEEEMRLTYNAFDVQITTTQGEGFGLTTLEGMACGVPQIVPNWSALGELTKDAALQIPCSSTHIGFPYVNVIGGVPDEQPFVDALKAMRDPNVRETFRMRGYNRVHEDRFRWETVGFSFEKAIDSVLHVPIIEEVTA